MTKKELKKLDCLFQTFTQVVYAYNQNNKEDLWLQLHWLAHDIDNLFRGYEGDIGYEIDLKGLWKYGRDDEDE